MDNNHEVTEAAIDVTLLNNEQKYLDKAVNGQGGFQSLLRKLNNQRNGRKVTLFLKDCERITRYATKYGVGGFEKRLNSILEPAKYLLSSKNQEVQ